MTQSEQQGERIVWVGRPSQLVNLRAFILGGLFFWLIVPAIVAVWRWLQIRCTQYELTNERLRVTSGVLSRRTDDLELYRVKDTSFDQPFILRVFSKANINLVTSDSNSPASEILCIPAGKASQLREKIRRSVESLRASKRVREIDVE
jgi:uncharacterized membrane protein YdbT with pleckstrin-like domain